jgi:hypothetical protein
MYVSLDRSGPVCSEAHVMSIFSHTAARLAVVVQVSLQTAIDSLHEINFPINLRNYVFLLINSTGFNRSVPDL